MSTVSAAHLPAVFCDDSEQTEAPETFVEYMFLYNVAVTFIFKVSYQTHFGAFLFHSDIMGRVSPGAAPSPHCHVVSLLTQ